MCEALLSRPKDCSVKEDGFFNYSFQNHAIKEDSFFNYSPQNFSVKEDGLFAVGLVYVATLSHI